MRNEEERGRFAAETQRPQSLKYVEGTERFFVRAALT
jgi:hypothetical protein